MGLVGLAVFSACIGRFAVQPGQVLHALAASMGLMAGANTPQTHMVHSVVFGARLPRIGGAICVGAALSVAGAAYQAVFRNPLVSPGLLGVLAGAGTGAALGIVWGLGPVGVAGLSFAGGLLAVACGVGVAHLFDATSMLMLVFGGLISSALFTALLSLLKYIADPQNQLPDIVFWLLGSLTQVTPHALGVMAGPVVVGIVLLSACGRMLDGLAMGDEEARTLGIPVMALRYGVIGAATVLAALTVSVAGMIGWVGLVVPHVARLLVGPCNMRVLPASACLGGMFLLVCDDLARTLSVEEIPVGLIADLLGVALFVAVLPLLRRGWRA
ncbi:ABC transporter permease [Komagataeibacter nataicola]|uniref:ABC transporter permease n=1 Tax=Komagataeibacter nataicola TaxID=265960 RepID=A0A9N7CNQ2_9PROT|nr:iron ABC transporter permease [Komagataeibacter nataicola]AQU89078.1 ABC transporter permease [Komagataeibacter nataicola]PYD66964.1 ABC transporter permease [Komagataeibacter nataicola]WEQ57336.1 iron ABC transporter permease [Komagataeibacter nataicola]WNM10024.1 iron ABC transporter permease [Komagataeibacter nataicola]GBR20436.1 Fe3+-siderophore ABC transporter permease [Komagataeibacter nataicola NRIC 0616]